MILLDSHRRIGLAAIFACTLVGAALRITRLGSLGLIQFDEGIYAIAGLWCFDPGGIRGIDPMVIPYAPPAFPLLVGISYSLLGVSDFSAIVVSVMAGIITIPVVAWVGWRTFGVQAGAASAAFVALSGVHVAFSRMALTDASFLLAWVVAMGIGQRFVEHLRLSRAVALGIVVGLVQYFKYNGWLTGVATALAVVLSMTLDPLERGRGRIVRTVVLGSAAALIAVLVYSVWFRFVESHGGYAGLLVHQRGYMGGLSSWLPHWNSQLAQGVALSGEPVWGAIAMLVAFGSVWSSNPKVGGMVGNATLAAAGLLAVLLLSFVPMLSWWVALGWTLSPWSSRPVAARVLGGWWLTLAAMTPFYHPYARLWLPLHAASWIIMAGVLASLVPWIQQWGEAIRPAALPRRMPLVVGLVAAIAIGHFLLDTPRPRPLQGLLGPSDSLRTACHQLASALPANVPEIRLLARPPVRYYLALSGRGPLHPVADLESLLRLVDPAAWVVVDETILRQEGDPQVARGRLLEHYDVVNEWSTQLNLPTLLDVDPAASRRESRARSGSLLLLRPRRPRVSP